MGICSNFLRQADDLFCLENKIMYNLPFFIHYNIVISTDLICLIKRIQFENKITKYILL